MSEQTIPAEKVRELADKYSGDVPTDPHFLLGEIKADLRALLPTLQPTTGLLGRWAKHPEHGDVMCVWDLPDGANCMFVRWAAEKSVVGVDGVCVPLASLTFPHQANRPAEVQPGEAWLVDVKDEYSAYEGVFALKSEPGYWRTASGITSFEDWRDREVTLLAPLTPERPGKDDLLWKYAILQQDYAHLEEECNDLQARYDVMDAKYWEAVEKIAELKESKPAWRIEHDWRNLKAGEYAIDKEGYDGIIRRKSNDGSYWLTDESWVFFPEYAPFIVFPSVDAATPEAIEEAKRARDKEMKK